MFNIPVDVTEFPQGAGAADQQPLGIATITTLGGDSNIKGYYGLQPPAGHGPHRYLYAVHAVDVETLDIPEDATATVLGFNLYFHSIGRSILWGWYENA